MTTEEAKCIRIEDFLSENGFKPTKQTGHNLWYLSPLRSESNASFKVDTEKNVWYDFGNGEGGNIIDLAMKMYQCNSVSETLRRMGHGAAPIRPHTETVTPTPKQTTPAFTDMEITGLHSPGLLQYVESRGISAAMAQRYCKEVRYSHEDKRYFAIGFENRSGGYEIRNKFFKGCVAPKDVTMIRENADNVDCAVFEGFFDFLSARDNGRMVDQYTDSIVLNSVANVDKAIPLLNKYKSIECYLDNDEAGRRTFAKLCDRLGKDKVVNRSGIYGNHKDLNDWLVASKKVGLSTTFSILVDGKEYERTHDRGTAAFLFSSLDKTCLLDYDGHTKTLKDDTGRTLKEGIIQARLAQTLPNEEIHSDEKFKQAINAVVAFAQSHAAFPSKEQTAAVNDWLTAYVGSASATDIAERRSAVGKLSAKAAQSLDELQQLKAERTLNGIAENPDYSMPEHRGWHR